MFGTQRPYFKNTVIYYIVGIVMKNNAYELKKDKGGKNDEFQ